MKAMAWLTFLALLIFSCRVAVRDAKTVEVKIGVVVNDTEGLAGKRVLTTLDMALSDFYAARPEFNTRLVLHPRSSHNDAITSASSVVDLIKNVQVGAIVGPETSMEAPFDISLGDKAHVPVVSYSATSPFLSSIASDYFVQATQVDSAQVLAISSLIRAFRWTKVTLIYVDNEFGGGLIPSLTDTLQHIGAHIPHRSRISSLATDDQISMELDKLKHMPTRVFIVHMEARLGTRLFSLAQRNGMMSSEYVWIVTNGIGNLLNVLDTVTLKPLEGVIGIKTYFPPSKEVDSFEIRWKKRLVRENPNMSDPKITQYELWAYDAITLLARAVEKVGGTRYKFKQTKASSNGSSNDLSSFGVSQAGQKLIRAIQSTTFGGLGGDFELVNGQLQSSIFEIVNVNENMVNTVGFWTPESGFLTRMDLLNVSTYSVTRERLAPITWPGKNNVQPKGWVIATNETRLRILVPVKDGFEQFVNVTPFDVNGYCIHVFDTVMQSLPYKISYDYVPYKGHDAPPTESYDELISEVYYQRYDAAIGDFTILANRSSYVDFSLPYIGSGVVMIAPVKDRNKNMRWAFIKPLSWELWVTTLCYFLLFAFIVWALEHTINPYFVGTIKHQFGVSLYYSFSTMVFAQSHNVQGNFTRCVVIVWFFFVLILTQSYTASLASILTVKQLQPTVTDIDELIKNKEAVGHHEGSFVRELLIQKGFSDPKLLKPYKSVRELNDLLTKGTLNGGIAAAFDEIPYIKVFLASYCSKYVMVPPIYKANGFGFVFPLGSPLVADISRQVLKVTDGSKMLDIENKWFGNKETCPESSSSSTVSPSSLGLDSFWELFIITGVATILALTMYILMFLYETEHVWLSCDRDVSISDRVKELVQIFHKKKTIPQTLTMGGRQNVT